MNRKAPASKSSIQTFVGLGVVSLLIVAFFCGGCSCNNQDGQNNPGRKKGATFPAYIPRLVLDKNGNASIKLEKFQSTYEKKLSPENWFSDPKTLDLCYAIIDKDADKIQAAIDAGADPNAQGKDNIPIILWAMPAGETGVSLLLKNGANPNTIIEKNYFGDTDSQDAGDSVLHVATVASTLFMDGSLAKLPHLFLDYGADPNLGKRHLLMYTLFSAHDETLINRILDSGIDVNYQYDKSDPDFSILMTAWVHRPQQVLNILKHGAIFDPSTPQGSQLHNELYRYLQYESGNQFDSKNAWYNRHKNNAPEIIEWLEEHGVSFDEPVPLLNRKTIGNANAKEHFELCDAKLRELQTRLDEIRDEVRSNRSDDNKREPVLNCLDEYRSTIQEHAEFLATADAAEFVSDYINGIYRFLDAYYDSLSEAARGTPAFLEDVLQVSRNDVDRYKIDRNRKTEEIRIDSIRNSAQHLVFNCRKTDAIRTGDSSEIRKFVDEILAETANSPELRRMTQGIAFDIRVAGYPEQALRLIDAALDAYSDSDRKYGNDRGAKELKAKIEEEISKKASSDEKRSHAQDAV